MSIGTLLVIVFIAALTRCMNSNYENDRVTRLPRQPRSPSVSQFSGYITVNESHGRALFYWFIEAQSQPIDRPLLLWLNGGPGCSSIGYGASIEMGPLNLDKDGLHFNKHAWNQEANVLFLEFPVGVGFSYTNTSDDFDQLDDAFTAEDNYAFLVRFLKKYPQNKNSEVYIGGESYAGHYVSQLAELVSDRNRYGRSKYPNINLKGFIIGNPLLDEYYDYKGILEYAWSHSIISNQNYYEAVRTCDFSRFDWSTECGDAMVMLWDQYKAIDMYNIYAPTCILNNTTSSSSSFVTAKGRIKMLAGGAYDPCFEQYPDVYFNRRDVQRAMHVNLRHDKGKTVKWQLCNYTMFRSYNADVFSVKKIFQKLTKRDLRIWLYSGDEDGRLPFLSTEYFAEALRLSLKSNWTTWFYQDQVAGRVIEYKGLTFATVRGAGHSVPFDQPAQASLLIRSYLSGQPLPTQK